MFSDWLSSKLIRSFTVVLLAVFSCFGQQTAEDHIQHGKDQLAAKKYLDAMASFEAAVKLNPSLPAAYYYRGTLQLDHTLAIADLTKAIELKPDYAEAYYQRGLIQDLESKNAAALKDYSKAIELNPRYLEAYMGRAVVYLLDHKGPLAIADYTTIIKLRPDGASYYMRGNSYLEIGQPAWAIRDLTKAIELDPTYYWSYKRRAKAYLQLGKYSLAQADERRAAKIGPPKVD